MTAHPKVVAAVEEVGCMAPSDPYAEGWNDALSAVLDASTPSNYGYRVCECGRYSQESQGLCICGRPLDGHVVAGDAS